MILEEIEGSVKVTLAGKTLSIGENVADYAKGILVIGTGKAIFRVDPSATFEVKGVEVVAEEVAVPAAPAPTPAPVPASVFTPAPVETAPVAELVPAPVEAPSPAAQETAKK